MKETNAPAEQIQFSIREGAEKSPEEDCRLKQKFLSIYFTFFFRIISAINHEQSRFSFPKKWKLLYVVAKIEQWDNF